METEDIIFSVTSLPVSKLTLYTYGNVVFLSGSLGCHPPPPHPHPTIDIQGAEVGQFKYILAKEASKNEKWRQCLRLHCVWILLITSTSSQAVAKIPWRLFPIYL